MGHAFFPLPSRLRDHWGRGKRRTVGSRESRHPRQNNICWAGEGSYTHELREAGTACVISAQDQANPNPSVDRGRTHEVPPLTEELWVTAGCWQRESQFSLGMQPQRGYICSRRWSYIHVHTGSRQWVQGGQGVGETGKELERGNGGSWFDLNTIYVCMNISKNKEEVIKNLKRSHHFGTYRVVGPAVVQAVFEAVFLRQSLPSIDSILCWWYMWSWRVQQIFLK